MQFIYFISSLDNIRSKSSCPAGCGFKTRGDIPIVGIPGPQKHNKFLGVIISRDPTTAFIAPYMEARQEPPDIWHHRLMTAKAPPQWLIGQISVFNRKYLDSQFTTEIGRLKEIIENNVYWTHLHKCCTDKSSRAAPRFKTKNARLCAGRWLRQELSGAIEQGAKFIVCVGKDAGAWVMEWEKATGANGIPVYYLPHPSGAASGAWNPKDEGKMKELKSSIIGLLQQCNKGLS